MPSPENLIRYRKRYADGLPDHAKVIRPTGVDDGGGGNTGVPVEVEPDLKARAMPMQRPRTTVIGNKPVVVADWVIDVADPDGQRAPSALDVLPNDDVYIGDFLFRMIDNDAATSEAICLTIFAKRVR